jgi:hypothetical protein
MAKGVVDDDESSLALYRVGFLHFRTFFSRQDATTKGDTVIVSSFRVMTTSDGNDGNDA